MTSRGQVISSRLEFRRKRTGGSESSKMKAEVSASQDVEHKEVVIQSEQTEVVIQSKYEE